MSDDEAVGGYGAYEAEEEEEEQPKVVKKKEKPVKVVVQDDPESLQKMKLDWVKAQQELASFRLALRDAPKFHWIMRFQEIMLQPDSADRRCALVRYSDSFIEEASHVGRKILMELNLPNEKKTIKAVQIGGVAGGEKFIFNGILYKLAVDPKLSEGGWLYGDTEPDMTLAAKGASNEIKGANSYFQVFFQYEVPMTLPTQVMMDFGGYRLVAMPLLPLKQGKLVYGSGDAGKTVHNDNELVSDIMRFAGEKLHLAGHRVGDKLIFSAGDVEAHVGADGQLYLLDLARTYPPEAPSMTKHLPPKKTSVFYRILRPEFLKLLKQDNRPALSPDAFTMWGKASDPAHNNQARTQSQWMFQHLIPELAKALDDDYLKDKFDDSDLEEEMNVYLRENSHLEEPLAAFRRMWSAKACAPYFDGAALIDVLQASELLAIWGKCNYQGKNPDLVPPPTRLYGVFNTFLPTLDLACRLHARGINMRHLGLVRAFVKQAPVKDHILFEMVKREVKDQFRRFLRKFQDTQTGKGMEDACVEFFTSIMGDATSRTAFWEKLLPGRIREHFGQNSITDEESESLFACAMLNNRPAELLRYVGQTSCFVFKAKQLDRWVQVLSTKEPPFYPGLSVMAKWKEQDYDGELYPAVIKKRNKDGTYIVHYMDDGYQDNACPESAIYIQKWFVGQKVKATWEGYEGVFDAEIKAISPKMTYNLKYADGSTWPDAPASTIVSGAALNPLSRKDIIPRVRAKTMSFQGYVKAYALTEAAVQTVASCEYSEFVEKMAEAEAVCSAFLSSNPNSPVMRHLFRTLNKIAQVNRKNLSFEEKKQINLMFLDLYKGEMETDEEKADAKLCDGAEHKDLEEMRALRKVIWKALVENLPKETCTDLLCTAVRFQKDVKIAEFLVKHGAEVNGTEPLWDFTVCKLAAWEGNFDMLKYLLDQGGDVNDLRGGNDRTLFFTAVQHDFLDCMELILDRCEDEQVVSVADNEGTSPLHWAAMRSLTRSIDWLCARGADVNSKDNGNKTPLDTAEEWGMTEAAELLKKHGGKHASEC